VTWTPATISRPSEWTAFSAVGEYPISDAPDSTSMARRARSSLPTAVSSDHLPPPQRQGARTLTARVRNNPELWRTAAPTRPAAGRGFSKKRDLGRAARWSTPTDAAMSAHLGPPGSIVAPTADLGTKSAGRCASLCRGRELALDPDAAPARVLPGQPKDQLANLRGQRQAPDALRPVSPLAPDQLSVPTTQGRGRDEERAPTLPRQHARRGCEQNPIQSPEPGAPGLAGSTFN
jgi:hypothetical protein